MTPDTAYQNAVARKKKILKELEDIDLFLELYKIFSGVDISPAGSSEPVIVGMPGAATGSSRDAEPAKASISQEEFENEARAILLRHGRPMKRGELVSAFEAKGIEIGGKNVTKNLGTKIWRAGDKFINIESEGYWPKDTACPAVGYSPLVAKTSPEPAKSEAKSIFD